MTEIKNVNSDLSSEAINQIKNVSQEKKKKPETRIDAKLEKKTIINSFEQLIQICSQKKEMKLKYELEKNVNLVSFEKNRIEVSFNENLDKDFVKDLSLKLYEWSNERWIITFSKIKGEISIKDKEKNKKIELVEKAKQSELYNVVISKFSDAELVNVETKKNDKS